MGILVITGVLEEFPGIVSGAGNSQTKGELPGKCGGGQDQMWTYNKGIYISSDNVLLNLQLS